MEARKKAGPFLPKWNKVKSRHKAFDGPFFKPDIMPAITAYDQALKEYDTQLKEQEKLKDMIVELRKKNTENAAEIGKLNGELAQMTKKSMDIIIKNNSQLDKYAANPGGDIDSVMGILDTNASEAETFVNTRKQRWEEIDGVAYQNLVQAKKARDDFKKQAGTIKTEMKKIEDAANAAESDIIGIIGQYVGIAQDMEHPDIEKELKALKCV
jgi:hypothetical protein